MKQFTAILFFLVLVFNFYGYRMIIACMQKGNEVAIEQKLDKNDYNDEELISIKTVLNLPYYTSSATYERTYGSVTIKGEVYEYVKRRVYQDTLELLCLPNNAKTKLQNVQNDLSKASADGQASIPVKKGASTLKISWPDFCQSFETIPVVSVNIPGTHLLQNDSFTFSDFTQLQERPPQAI